MWVGFLLHSFRAPLHVQKSVLHFEESHFCLSAPENELQKYILLVTQTFHICLLHSHNIKRRVLPWLWQKVDVIHKWLFLTVNHSQRALQGGYHLISWSKRDISAPSTQSPRLLVWRYELLVLWDWYFHYTRYTLQSHIF